MDIEGSMDLKGNIKDGLLIEIEETINKCDGLKEPQMSISKTILKVLKFMIEDKELYVPKAENRDLEDTEIPEHIQKLCNAVKISYNQAVSIFDFEEEVIKLNTLVEGANALEKQLNATLSILTAYYYCYGKDEIKSKELSGQLKWLGIKSLGNLAKNLKKKDHEHCIEVRGTGSNLTYKIKRQGIDNGKKIIKDLSMQYA